jgi:hypothetical protein
VQRFFGVSHCSSCGTDQTERLKLASLPGAEEGAKTDPLAIREWPIKNTPKLPVK